MPRRSSSVAGAGSGIPPCSESATPPFPSGSGEQLMRATSSASTAAHTPTTSPSASIAPSSWKCTRSTGRPWMRASARATRSKAARLRSRTRAESRARPSRARIDFKVRSAGRRARPSSATQRASSAPRATRRVRMRIGPTPSAAWARRTAGAGAPTSSSAPSSMLPAAPEKQSKWRTRTPPPLDAVDERGDVRGSEAVVDVHDRHVRGARVQHREQRRDTTQ